MAEEKGSKLDWARVQREANWRADEAKARARAVAGEGWRSSGKGAEIVVVPVVPVVRGERRDGSVKAGAVGSVGQGAGIAKEGAAERIARARKAVAEKEGGLPLYAPEGECECCDRARAAASREGGFDRGAYQREYMRARRAKRKGS